MTDNTRLERYRGIYFLASLILRLSNVEHSQRLRDAKKKCIVCQYSPRADSSPKPEHKLCWVWFGLAAVGCKESFGLESHGVVIDIWIVRKVPNPVLDCLPR